MSNNLDKTIEHVEEDEAQATILHQIRNIEESIDTNQFLASSNKYLIATIVSLNAQISALNRHINRLDESITHLGNEIDYLQNEVIPNLKSSISF